LRKEPSLSIVDRVVERLTAYAALMEGKSGVAELSEISIAEEDVALFRETAIHDVFNKLKPTAAPPEHTAKSNKLRVLPRAVLIEGIRAYLGDVAHAVEVSHIVPSPSTKDDRAESLRLFRKLWASFLTAASDRQAGRAWLNAIPKDVRDVLRQHLDQHARRVPKEPSMDEMRKIVNKLQSYREQMDDAEHKNKILISPVDIDLFSGTTLHEVGFLMIIFAHTHLTTLGIRSVDGLHSGVSYWSGEATGS